jgi:hypothetical protein
MKKNRPQIKKSNKIFSHKDTRSYTNCFSLCVPLCPFVAKFFSEKPGGSKIAGMPQISTQIFDKGYLSPRGRLKGILRHSKEQRPESVIKKAFPVLAIFAILSRLKRD